MGVAEAFLGEAKIPLGRKKKKTKKQKHYAFDLSKFNLTESLLSSDITLQR